MATRSAAVPSVSVCSALTPLRCLVTARRGEIVRRVIRSLPETRWRNAPKGMQLSNVSGATYTTARSLASESTALTCHARSSQAATQSTVPTGISSPSSRRTAPAPLPRLRGLSAVRRGTRPFANRLPRRHWATAATAIVARPVELGLHRYAGNNQAMGRIWTATVMASPASRSDDR